MNLELVRFRTESGARSALIERGTKLLHVLAIVDGPLTVLNVPLSEERFATPLTLRGAPYPMKRALRMFKRHGKTFGATKAAKKMLARAAGSIASPGGCE